MISLNLLFLFFLSLVILPLSRSSLVLNDTFVNLDNWVIHIDGSTGVVEVVNATSNYYVDPGVTNIENPNTLFTNVTHCPQNGCFRAEVALEQSLRPSVFANCSVQYWAGTSIYIPTSWIYRSSAVQDMTYHFQIHGGDNEGNAPMFSIKVESDNMVIGVCGNTGINAADVCIDYYVGGVALGQWMDFVVNSQLAYGQPTGWVKVWRNGVLMVDASNILTSYDEINPPYPILGSYEYNWKINQTTGFQWTSCYHNAVKIGNASSNYDEVYTGNGAPCGSYCNINTDNSTFNTDYLWFIIPLGLVSIFSIVLFFGSSGYREKKWTNGRDSQATNNRSSGSKSLRLGGGAGDASSRHDISLTYSFGRFLNGLDPYAESKPENQEWSDLISVFRRTSTTRTIFWYGFAVFWTFLAFFGALILYGGPGIFLKDYRYSHGFIPYKHISDWSAIQMTMAVISATMTVIYFLPLIYLPHDFNSGKKFKNNPAFLKKIGVIIPCHKSSKEIGEVLRRTLKYIPPENIVVCDNGNFDWPPDNTFEVVKKMHQKIRYVYIKQGHKTRALWTGVHRLPSHVEYIIHLDDDTHFDEHHMVFDEKHFEEKHVIAVAFLRSSYPTNTVTQFTDFWYKITDHFHATQAKICTRCFVPGPAGMWKRDKFMEIFGEHPSLPFGEDIFGGFTTLNNGYAIRSETRCMVTTFAPDILVPWFLNLNTARVQGYGASSLWKQRAHRWTVSALRITGKSLYSFFTYDSKLGIASNIAFRLYRFREYKLILVQLLYIPFCLVILSRGFYLEFIVLKILLFILPLMRNVYINYICWYNQPELQVPLKTVLLSPLFNFFLICCAIHGRWKCILWYLPNVAPNHGMLQTCRPKPLKSVPVEDNETYTADLLVRTISTSSATSELQKSRDGNPSFATNAFPTVSTGTAPVRSVFHSTEMEEREMGTITEEQSELRADKVLKYSDNAFELFERGDGSSKIVFYVPKGKAIDEEEEDEENKKADSEQGDGGHGTVSANPLHIPPVKAVPIDEESNSRKSLSIESEKKEYIDV